MTGRALFASLNRRDQVRRLTALARAALAEYGLADAPIRLVGHLYNTVFRVAAPGGSCVLRINRPGGKTPAQVRSEMQWLAALRRDTGLGVPEPMPTRGGELVTQASAPGVPEPRICALLGWVPGRFRERGLRPVHLARVGGFIARLHEHAVGFEPPSEFTRDAVGLLSEARVAEIVQLVAAHASAADADAVATVVAEARRMKDATDGWLGGRGLIHADLHHFNYLFDGAEVHAIDFDDCGVGPFLYDLAVAVAQLHWHPRYPELRGALLRGYLSCRALPDGFEAHLDALVAQRQVEGIAWRLSMAAEPAFQEWAAREVAEMLPAVRAFVHRSTATP